MVANGTSLGPSAASPWHAALPDSLLDYVQSILLVFGGCCSNSWSLERVIQYDPTIGTTLTFLQVSFIALHTFPHFVEWSLHGHWWLPRLKPPVVPFSQWAIQVVVFTVTQLLNNWVFAYQIPLTLQIVFRSGGLGVSMLFGMLFSGKRYNFRQIVSVLLVSLGVLLATLSKPRSSAVPVETDEADVKAYWTGVALLTLSLLSAAVLGTLQEKTSEKYGSHWKEGLFYTHALSLPIFLFFISDIRQGFERLSHPPARLDQKPYSGDPLWSSIPSIYYVLAANLLTQLVCVSGVNRLTSSVSAVSTNLILTARKAASLIFNVWWFGSGWNRELLIGGGLVIFGTFLYTTSSTTAPAALKKEHQD